MLRLERESTLYKEVKLWRLKRRIEVEESFLWSWSVWVQSAAWALKTEETLSEEGADTLHAIQRPYGTHSHYQAEAESRGN